MTKPLKIIALTILLFLTLFVGLQISAQKDQNPGSARHSNGSELNALNSVPTATEAERKKRNNPNLVLIPIEEYQGDLENLPEGAFRKGKVVINAKTGERTKQIYIALPRQ